jgi:hypothetical protein
MTKAGQLNQNGHFDMVSFFLLPNKQYFLTRKNLYGRQQGVRYGRGCAGYHQKDGGQGRRQGWGVLL